MTYPLRVKLPTTVYNDFTIIAKVKITTMKKGILLLLSIISLQVFAQDSASPVLMTIDDREITKSDFETIYKKNNRDSSITKEDLDEYLELFINFKLKVLEAEELGMDTLTRFERELSGYRDQLARPYLVDKAVTDSLVREAYDRLAQDVRASHILIKLPPSPSPIDTLTAYNKLMAVKAKVDAEPTKFGEIAKTQSEDPSAKSNNGDLGYFTSLQMIYSFETAVYNSKIGDITGPVRTRYGYHLILTTDKRAARGEVRVAHIMIKSEDSDPEEVKASLKKRADEVYEKLEAGEDFGVLARKFSDDRTSAAKGGELPEFGAGKMVEEFEEASFALTEPDQITEPIKSPYGWHIIKLIERVPVKSFDDYEKELRSKISRDSRSDITKDSFINKRKKEYDYVDYRKRLKPFYTGIDTSYFNARWEPSADLQNQDKALFEMIHLSFSQADFTAFLLSRMRASRTQMDIELLVNESFENWVDSEIMAFEDGILEEKHPEFKALMQEYRDGILLFDLTDQKVWSKAVEDTVGLDAFYQENQNDFMWEERAGYDVYTVEDEATASKVRKMLKKGKNQDEIRGALNEDSALKVRVGSGLKEQKKEPILEKVVWEVGVSDPIDDEGQLKVIHIKEIRQPEPKAFDDARGLITAAYQNYLEKEWIESLRAKHEVSVEKEVLYTIK
ncbi:MAG: peptidyl-prolyl cis-trans isomerase SurA [Cryomorphaceae bacterium]|jgi:peptidyl-prolyl cis-trans isomerase SurA